jgi:hypothetical protein
MKETEIHCDHIPALGGMAVVCHIPYNVPAKLYHKESNPPIHETYHFWQALRLPFLYFYGLKYFYNVIKALPQLLPLVAIPEARKGFAIGAVPEFAQISQKRRVSMWPERATIDSEDVPSASDAQVSARISCLDLAAVDQ